MWVRATGTRRSEMVVATDSRLTGGLKWNGAPKIVLPERGDCVLCFSGDTAYAYPLLLHTLEVVTSHEETRTRRITLESLNGFLRRSWESVLTTIDYSALHGRDEYAFVEILLGGYSWDWQRWRIWRTRFYPEGPMRTRLWALRRADQFPILWTGDRLAVGEAKKRINWISAGMAGPTYNMEPLKILRDIVHEQRHESVGGPVQLAKVYPRLQSLQFTVAWEEDGQPLRAIGGRMLGQREEADLPVIDLNNPDTMEWLRTDE